MEETKYSHITNESNQYRTHQSVQNSKQTYTTSISAEVELELKDKTPNLDEEETKYVPNYEYNNNHMQTNTKQNCNHCPDFSCIKHINKNQTNKKTQIPKDKIVARLSEDIWALGFVIARNRKKLPCSFVILLFVIYCVQIGILSGMIWAYDVEDQHTWKSYNAKYGTCLGTSLTHNGTTQYDVTIRWNQCYTIQLQELIKRRQTWVGLGWFLRDVISDEDDQPNMEPVSKTLSYDPIGVFPFTAMLSFLLLGFYISSSMTNPIIMFIIAYQQNKVLYVY